MNKEHSESLPPLGTCEFAVVDAPFDKPSDILAYYDRIRAYLQHEDGLLNTRLTWSLSVHAFLFAIYGLILGREVDLCVLLQGMNSKSVLLRHVLSSLFFLQVVVASLGFSVGLQSRRAILAAAMAIQHLCAICHSSMALKLDTSRRQARIETEIAPGPQRVAPTSMLTIGVDTSLLVDPDAGSDEEIVEVTEISGGTFVANFKNRHRSGALITQLGSVLLPKVIGGGAGVKTFHARSYYLGLPNGAKWVWLVFGVISLSFCALSLIYPDWLYSVPYF